MRYLIAVVALAGLVVSSVALQMHYSTDTNQSDVNEMWDCGLVNHSSYAAVRHIPVAAVGIGGYLVLGTLALMRQRFLLLLAAFAGFCFALRLTFIEQFALGVWCRYCVLSQAVIALLLFLSVGWLAVEYIGLKRMANQR